MTTKLIAQLKKITGMNDIPFVSSGVVVDDAISGHVISEDGVTALVEASISAEAAAARVTQLEGELVTAQAAKKNAEDALTVAKTTITAKETEVSTLTARVEELENDGSLTQTRKESDKNPKVKVAYHASDNDPFNKIADSFLGKPKENEPAK